MHHQLQQQPRHGRGNLKEIQAIGGEDCAFLYQADVSDYAQAEAMAKATYDHFGRIDGLVNNAALQKQWMLDEYPIKDYDLLMHVNLGGYINMMRAGPAVPEGDPRLHHLHSPPCTASAPRTLTRSTP